jgi:hypothetical protein
MYHLELMQKSFELTLIFYFCLQKMMLWCILLLGLGSLSSGQDITSAGEVLAECDPELLGFELVTGYVFTAPEDLLDSIPNTLMLTDCLEACHANESCHSVNYETGLCVLFASNADNYPGKS